MAGTEFFKNVTGNYWFSFVAYVMVIATWSALMGNDFISSSWKSVRDTRKRGIGHLIAVTFPMGFMPVYMFFQFKTGDYNEMNSGLVALMFALLHMSRTIWGLWQLQIFREWFIESRKSMVSLGYGMKQDDNGDDEDGSDEDSLMKRINEEADEVEVNDLIVDNRLTDGEVQCHLRFLSTEERKELETSPFLKRIGSQMWFTLRRALLLPLLLWSIVKTRSRSRTRRGLRMEPKEPEEIWLRWATLLVAHALPEWLSDMKKARSGESQDGNGESFEIVRDRFASEVLMSAVLHSRKTGNAWEENGVSVDGESDENVDRGAGHSCLSFEKWDRYPMLRKGTFNKQEFFRHACVSGKGLPFEIPHELAKTVREGCAHYSYQKFKGKLDRARDDMPVEMGEKAIEFGVEELEWLAIFLSVGRWSSGVRSKQDNGSMDEEGEHDDELGLPAENLGSQLGFARGAQAFYDVLSGPLLRNTIGRVLWGNRQVSEVSAHSDKRDNGSVDEAGDRDDELGLPAENLASQLGFARGAQAFHDMLSGPLLRNTIGRVLWGNRQVSEVSAHIDNWMALCVGEQTAYVESKIPSVKKKCMVDHVEGTVDTEEVQEEADEVEAVSNGRFATENVWKENEDLERQRFLLQLTIVEPEFLHFDKSISFMGCSMENLRSSLATWAERNENAAAIVWEPEICESKGIKFCASNDLQQLLVSLEGKKSLEERFVHMRLLWELQNHLQERLPREGISPSQKEAMMLCVLSFPAICANVREWTGEDECHGVSAQRCCCVIVVDRKSIDAAYFKIEKYEAVFRAVCGPQDVQVVIRFSRQDNGSAVSINAKLRVGESTSERFSWEAWRDAFGGRLAGAEKSKAEIGGASWSVCRTRRRISSGVSLFDASKAGTGEMRMWDGWLPTRSDISMYEMTSQGFIMKVQNSKPIKVETELLRGTRTIFNLRTRISAPVSYADADNMSLKHASLIVVEVVRGFSQSEEATNRSPWRVEDIRMRADRLLESGRKEDLDVALTLYEVAVTAMEDGDALGKALQILFEGGRSRKAAQDAVTLIEGFYMPRNAGKLQGASLRSMRNQFGDEKWVAFIDKQFAYVLNESMNEASVAVAYANFCAVLWSFQKVGRRERAIAALARSTVHFSKISKGDYNFACSKALEYTLDKSTEEGFAIAIARNENVMAHVDNLRDKMKTVGSRNQHRAAELYKRAIEEGEYVDAMVNLANLLKEGAEGVPANAHRAAELYNRAIEEGEDVVAMYNLAILLKKGAEGVPANAPCAAELYNRAIEAGDHVDAMVNLANLLKEGAEGVPANAPCAAELYNRAIEEGEDVVAMYNLANLLKKGAEGVPANAHRSAELYNRAIEEGEHVDAMYNLANLLKKGAEGVPANAHRAAELYNRAIEEGEHVGAMNNLAILLEEGADGVPANAHRAAELYNRAIEEGEDVDAMVNLAKYSLSKLLRDGADGVPADPVRAEQLLQSARSETQMSVLGV